MEKSLETFHSLGRVKFLVAGTAVIFLGLFILMLSLIQDYLGNEFKQFDTISLFITRGIFDETWFPFMKQIALLASLKVLIPVTVLTFLWIWFKGKDRRLETAFLLFVMIGGEILDEGLRHW